MNTTYLTVAIPYVNAEPHLGYAYELIQADIHARARRSLGHTVRFLGGTDDYSLKNVLAAEQVGETTSAFVNRNAARFEALAGPLNLTFDDFIRTSNDERHIPAVHRLWQAALDAGDLYEKDYEGDYCVGCERFYDPAELVGGICPEHQLKPERVSERNWFFRLAKYQDYLEDLISSDELAIRPEAFKREALAFVRAGLADISVSRSVERARGWGVPVPGDPSQIIYVWFDALTNYISALEFGDRDSAQHRRWWSASDERIHVVGKGILRFHAIFWPAFLASAGEPAPSQIRVHPYLSIDGKKLSKSSGPTVDPLDIVERYGVDALRWFFAREVNEVADTDFTIERLVGRANDELVNSIGNAVNRVLTLVHRHLESRVPSAQPLTEVVNLVERTRSAIIDFELREAAALIAQAAADLNADITNTAPWLLTKNPEDAGNLADVLAKHVATARLIAQALEPITPGFAAALLHQLGEATALLPPNAPTYERLAVM